MCFLFFFQAEDGIRDYKVTGVQTCALPISDQRRCIRHAAHELAVAAEPARKRVEPHAGSDADHELAAHRAGERRSRRAQVLRLHREHQRIGLLRSRVGRGARAHAVPRGEPLACRGAHLDHRDPARVDAFLEQPADQRARHVAAAEEGDPHAALLSFLRAPKIALPMRTSVAPSAMADSMSSDMPIDRVSKPNSPLRFSKAAFTVLKRILCKATSGVGSGTAIRPRRCRRGSGAMARASAAMASTATPLFVASPDTLTWISTLSCCRLEGRCSESRRAIFSRSSVCTQAKRSAAMRVLLLCNGPIKCHSSPGRATRRAWPPSALPGCIQ